MWKLILTCSETENDVENVVFANVEKPEVSLCPELREFDLPDGCHL
jgi:hypothetical protein